MILSDERLQQEVGEPLGRLLPALRLLQLLPDSPHVARHAAMEAGIADRVWELKELVA